MAKNPNYIYKKEKKMFWYGLLFGLVGGIFGNVLITSCFNLINNDCQNNICRYGTLTILIFSLIGFVYILKQIMDNIKKLK